MVNEIMMIMKWKYNKYIIINKMSIIKMKMKVKIWNKCIMIMKIMKMIIMMMKW